MAAKKGSEKALELLRYLPRINRHNVFPNREEKKGLVSGYNFIKYLFGKFTSNNLYKHCK